MIISQKIQPTAKRTDFVGLGLNGSAPVVFSSKKAIAEMGLSAKPDALNCVQVWQINGPGGVDKPLYAPLGRVYPGAYLMEQQGSYFVVKDSMDADFSHMLKLMDDAPGGIGAAVFAREIDSKALQSALRWTCNENGNAASMQHSASNTVANSIQPRLIPDSISGPGMLG